MKGTILTLHSKGKDDERIVRIAEPGIDAGEYFFFLPRSACWGLLVGIKKWTAWRSACWWGEHHTDVLAAEERGAGKRKAETCIFLWAFAYGVVLGNCSTAYMWITVYMWIWTCGFYSMQNKSKACIAKALILNQCSQFWTEGAEESISGSLVPGRQLFMQSGRFIEVCFSCALDWSSFVSVAVNYSSVWSQHLFIGLLSVLATLPSFLDGKASPPLK